MVPATIMPSYIPLQELIPTPAQTSPPGEPEPPPVIVPGTMTVPSFRLSSSLTPLVCDERAISRLLELVIEKSGLTLSEVAHRIGVTPNSIRQYIRSRRTRPSLIWFVRLAETCGARVSIEFPRPK